MTPEQFLAAVAPAAVTSMHATRIPASITLAQGALESSWGRSWGCELGCNLFNIKASKAWHGPTFWHDTIEHIGGKDIVVPAEWRKYETWLMAINDHARFLTDNPRYSACFKPGITNEQFAQALAAAGYATDPDYASKLIAMIRGRNLGKYDAT